MNLKCFIACCGMAVSLVGAGAAGDVEIPGMTLQEGWALRLSESGKSEHLPRLDYWGVGGMEWEGSASAASDSELKSAKGSKFLGLACRQKLGYKAAAGGLNSVAYYFAEGVTNRAGRLQVYHQIKSQLLDRYHAPTQSVRPDELVRGTDAYVQGLDKEYLLTWQGPETCLSLRLSDSQLCLEFHQAETSQAALLKQNLKNAEQKKLLIQKKMQDLKNSAGSPSASGKAN